MARRQRQPEIHEVTIESMSHEGRGIARINGKTVFVFGALEGERVRIRIRQRRRKFDQAETIEVLEPASQRVEPRCSAYQVCGGCSLQHLGADDQVEFKQDMLLEMFEHAGVAYDELLPPLRGPEWGYRSKARLGVKHVPKKDRVLVGFRERNSPFIADMQRCEVLLPQVGHELEGISAMIGRLEARARIPQIEVAADAENVQLVFRHLDPLSTHDLDILTDFARSTGFQLQLQPGGPDTVNPLYPEEQKLELEPQQDAALRINFNALDFVQVNREINQKMVAQALELLQLEPDHRVLDLFCGLGNFTLPMAAVCANVTGVEGDAAMVARARASARSNGLDNTDYDIWRQILEINLLGADGILSEKSAENLVRLASTTNVLPAMDAGTQHLHTLADSEVGLIDETMRATPEISGINLLTGERVDRLGADEAGSDSRGANAVAC